MPLRRFVALLENLGRYGGISVRFERPKDPESVADAFSKLFTKPRFVKKE